MTVHLELIGLPGCRLLFAPAGYLFECGMNIHAHLSHARSIFAPLRRDVLSACAATGRRGDGTIDAGMSSPEIICLLPARNEEDGSRGYLESAQSVCDAIVALDHGSTDATADILHAGPLVPRVISRPPIGSSRGGCSAWMPTSESTPTMRACSWRVTGCPGCGYREATFSNGSHAALPAP
jgi:hypothetical protein